MWHEKSFPEDEIISMDCTALAAALSIHATTLERPSVMEMGWSYDITDMGELACRGEYEG
jgi:hypothetical protein